MYYPYGPYIARIEPASHRQYPPDIRSLLASLSEARETVKDLTRRLESAQKEYERLEMGWKKYSLTLSPIRTCPPEILSMIFWICIFENPRRVRRLLPVCKQWHEIVINDPRLWNRIHIRVEREEWDMKLLSYAAKKHTQMCLKRAGGSLLDVKLDCSDLRSTEEHIMEKIKASFAGLFSLFDDPAETILEEWMSGLDVEALDVPEFAGNWRPQHVTSAIRLLVGNQSENMGRFGSLELSLPRFDDEKLAMKLWRFFNKASPSLHRLVITTSGIDNETTEGTLAGSFPSLTGLKYLDVDATLIFRSLTLESSSLETLVLHEGIPFWPAYNLPSSLVYKI